ncbi:MAG: hypothetical protein IJV82_02255 [Oscillospiraceae bacterium]|nr:hypothetical protein [Oscillospiraceae bacterium]
MGIFDFFKKDNSVHGNCKVGGSLFFGKYYFENEKDIRPIEWVVLESNRTELLLISKYCLDTVGYCGPSPEWGNASACIWENSYLRNWLNNDFYNRAFNKEEKQSIIETTIITDSSSDKMLHKNSIFILSEKQAITYFGESTARKGIPTPYAVSKGARLGWTDDTKEYTSWWLLPYVELTGGSPARMDYPCAVFQMGDTQYHGRNIGHTDFTVRPVIRIKK